MATYLDRILDAHRAAAARDRRDLLGLESRARSTGGPVRAFGAALAAGDEVAVIAEVKRSSPSKGLLVAHLDAAATAEAYQVGGAAALSVLTDREFFLGSADDLIAARAATTLPVLRKDFTVGPADVLDARCMGADAVLLIAAALPADQLQELMALAGSVGLDALVEVHDEHEAEAALGLGASLIGVNQRDLYSFEVDTERARRVAGMLPDSVIRVAESGIRDRDDVRCLRDAGFDAVLVGEALVSSPDPGAALRHLRSGAGRRAGR